MYRAPVNLILVVGCIVWSSACRPYTVSSGRPDLVWTDVTEQGDSFPPSVRIYEGVDEKAPLHAWYAKIDLSSPDVHVDIAYSDDEDGKETTSEIARSEGACVAVNAGYFTTSESGARHIGLLVSKGNFLHTATGGIIADDIRYPTARAAIGFQENGLAAVAWVTSTGDSVFAWPAPPPNRPGHPGNLPKSTEALLWRVENAVAAGPSLVHDGLVTVTVDEEVFFNSPIPNVHPRTAAGIHRDGSLLLVVVDGRQRESRGVSLNQMAEIMLDLGAEYALNLDGGGSSSFVVNGRLLNRPVGMPDEREVVSVISVRCLAEDAPNHPPE